MRTTTRGPQSARQFIPVAALLLLAASVQKSTADETAAGPKSNVTIRANFPGGNVLVKSIAGHTVHVAPDLRGGRPWFYWYFAARVERPGRVSFAFPKSTAIGIIGKQGPAVSVDNGKAWKWLGADHVRGDSFFFVFTEKVKTARFAVSIPYLQSHWDRFLKRNAANRHLTTTRLTKSRKGRRVELLQVGKPGPGVQAVLVTGRHHACETMASYVLEGFLQAAISDMPAGKSFRKRYVLYAVPFVDKDGVEDGDQGKNRKPYDHNRDYGEKSLYPEIRAIKKLADAKHIRFALDFHCPTLAIESHQVFYFVGAKNHPRNNFSNVERLAKLIKKQLPRKSPYGPLVWLKPVDKPVPMNSHYFGFRKSTIMAATLEVPFAPPGKLTDAARCRAYGGVILQAWTETRFQTSEVK